MFFQLVDRMAEQDGITEQFKVENQMEWGKIRASSKAQRTNQFFDFQIWCFVASSFPPKLCLLSPVGFVASFGMIQIRLIRSFVVGQLSMSGFVFSRFFRRHPRFKERACVGVAAGSGTNRSASSLSKGAVSSTMSLSALLRRGGFSVFHHIHCGKEQPSSIAAFVWSQHGLSPLVERGYDCGAIVLNASYFVPQSRPRVFIIAVKHGCQIPGELVGDSPCWLHTKAAIELGCFPCRVRR